MKSSDMTSELLRLKEKIEEARAEKNRIEGELRQLSKTMIEEFGTDQPKVIQTKIDALKKQSEALRNQIEKEIVALKEELGED